MRQFIIPLLTFALSTCPALAEIPRLVGEGEAANLLVDGKPFLILGGELGNSSGEAAYLEPYWDKLQALNLNTSVTPVSWALIEPEEGVYDWSSLDDMVEAARAHDMRLVLLWFGAWKNSMSAYAPDWVKTDLQRFPRARSADGTALEIISPLSETALEVELRTFRALMAHIREIDADHGTVLMIQVENEIGMVGDAREYSSLANQAFAADVPSALIRYLKANEQRLEPALKQAWIENGRRDTGDWETVFGESLATDELFMAWYFARYTNTLAAAGKEIYPLPMFANAALIRPGYQPGQYPSAGPLPHLFDVWKAGAPALDFLSPDIYFTNFAEWASRFARPGNPLFIPEALRNTDASVNALYAFGQLGAIGFSPFGIESTETRPAEMLSASYGMLEGLAPIIMEHQGTGTMAAALPEGPEQRQPYQIRLNNVQMQVTYERVTPPSLANGVLIPDSAGSGGTEILPSGMLVIATGPDEFIFAGIGVKVTFSSIDAGRQQVGILTAEEGTYDSEGNWHHVRWLSGDQTHQGRHIRLEPGRFVVQRVRLYRYE